MRTLKTHKKKLKHQNSNYRFLQISFVLRNVSFFCGFICFVIVFLLWNFILISKMLCSFFYIYIFFCFFICCCDLYIVFVSKDLLMGFALQGQRNIEDFPGPLDTFYKK